MWKEIFNDKGVKTSLRKYVEIVDGKRKPRYLSADLELKAAEAEERVQSCDFCERKCRVNRKEGKLGWCQVGYEARVSSAFAHVGEEPELTPSGTIFFSGCNFKCAYCQNWDISQHPENGNVWNPEKIAAWIKNSGCINVNFVGGEPTPNLHWILRSIGKCKAEVPVVWNSNFYMSKETMHVLDGVVDVYLGDFRYGNNDCALKYSTVPDYMETVTRNFLLAKDHAEILIRLLVLPEHVECCTKPIIKWIYENLGNHVRVNIMSQYKPEYRAGEFPEINRGLKRDEYYSAVDYAKELGLWNVEVQGMRLLRLW